MAERRRSCCKVRLATQLPIKQDWHVAIQGVVGRRGGGRKRETTVFLDASERNVERVERRANRS